MDAIISNGQLGSVLSDAIGNQTLTLSTEIKNVAFTIPAGAYYSVYSSVSNTEPKPCVLCTTPDDTIAEILSRLEAIITNSACNVASAVLNVKITSASIDSKSIGWINNSNAIINIDKSSIGSKDTSVTVTPCIMARKSSSGDFYILNAIRRSELSILSTVTYKSMFVFKFDSGNEYNSKGYVTSNPGDVCCYYADPIYNNSAYPFSYDLNLAGLYDLNSATGWRQFKDISLGLQCLTTSGTDHTFTLRQDINLSLTLSITIDLQYEYV